MTGVPSHERWMRVALEQADLARAQNEVPVGAVVALGDAVVGTGFNQPIGSDDPTAHAEVIALRAAAKAVGNYRLTGAVLCVTIEPCLMCVGAMWHARVGTIVYGAPEPKTGALGSVVDGVEALGWAGRVQVVSGILEADCRQALQGFFQGKRRPREP